MLYISVCTAKSPTVGARSSMLSNRNDAHNKHVHPYIQIAMKRIRIIVVLIAAFGLRRVASKFKPMVYDETAACATTCPDARVHSLCRPVRTRYSWIQFIGVYCFAPSYIQDFKPAPKCKDTLRLFDEMEFRKILLDGHNGLRSRAQLAYSISNMVMMVRGQQQFTCVGRQAHDILHHLAPTAALGHTSGGHGPTMALPMRPENRSMHRNGTNSG